MRFRCPYCRRVFGPERLKRCPSCGRVLLFPPESYDSSRRERERAKEAIRRDAARRTRALRSATRVPIGYRHAVIPAVVLLAVAGALVLLRLQPKRPVRPVDARLLRATHELTVLRTALLRFRDDCGRYPSEREGLRALVRAPDVEVWNGPYINLLMRDPWHTPYAYRQRRGSVSVRSAGPDGKPDTKDDFVVTVPSESLLTPP